MKSVVSYLLAPLLLCAYLAATVGFEVHSCTVEGSSKLRLMTGQSPCQHNDCGCHTHDDRCCQTSVYVIDDDQNTADYTKIVVLAFVLVIAWHNTFSDIYIPYDTTALDIDAYTIVFGPGGGLSAFAPLRC